MLSQNRQVTSKQKSNSKLKKLIKPRTGSWGGGGEAHCLYCVGIVRVHPIFECYKIGLNVTCRLHLQAVFQERPFQCILMGKSCHSLSGDISESTKVAQYEIV